MFNHIINRTPINQTLPSQPEKPHTLHVTDLENIQQCLYKYKFQNNTDPNPRLTQLQLNDEFLDKDIIFKTWDLAEELATNYLYGEKLWDTALLSILKSKQYGTTKQQQQLHQRAGLMKKYVADHPDYFPLASQKKMSVYFQTADNKVPIIKLVWTLDWLMNDHSIRDCKTSKGKRQPTDHEYKSQRRVYPWMYAIHKHWVNAVINSKESYTFDYVILTKHVTPQLQTIQATTSYAETTEYVLHLLNKYRDAHIRKTRATNKTWKCKMCPLRTHGCPVWDWEPSEEEFIL